MAREIDSMSLLRLVDKDTGLLLGLLSLPHHWFRGKPPAPCGLYDGEAHVARNEYFLLTAMEDLWLLGATRVSTQADFLPTSLEMTEDPHDILTAAL